MTNIDLKRIYLAGGCFWGIEAYFSKVDGIIDTKVGYANGNIENPTYEDVCSNESGYAETVQIDYNPKIISLEDILFRFFDIIDPTTLNRQGFDTGSQYRSGIYYTDYADRKIINTVLKRVSLNYELPIATEVVELDNFYPAEEYHQRYLDKNPHGYCHIDLSKVKKYVRPDDFVLKKTLSPLQYDVTQNGATEPPHSSPYIDNFKDGIYVDIVSGEALFSSKDKFKCDCGWPAFSKPIKEYFIKETCDTSHNMIRTEVRSAHANSHLGHVFEDGPLELGGRRYCINGSAIKFIPKDDLEQQGYGEYKSLFG